MAYSTLLTGEEHRRWLAARTGAPTAGPDSGEAVRVEREGEEQLTITLNLPERRNAYGRRLRDDLVSALSIAQIDQRIATVLLQGHGPSFCSGGDLAEFGLSTDAALAHLVRTTAGAAHALANVADRLTVRAHGPVVGAGVELMAFGARVEARRDTTFRLPELSMGLIPGAGGTESITRRIGRWRTGFLAGSGAGIDSALALDWRLVDAIVD
ncbi:MAG: enoyl-CoA hydratase/isomerase [Subtercola sp.]|nr:enoyl-CoA hydratase/isomerase [Subtercola sp.]